MNLNEYMRQAFFDEMTKDLYSSCGTCSGNTHDSTLTPDKIREAINALEAMPIRAKVIGSPYLTLRKERQTLIPRSKKKRIIKKCKKLYTVRWTEPDTEHVYYMEKQNTIICHELIEAQIKKALVQGQSMTHYSLYPTA
jgi:hypothetical protein